LALLVVAIYGSRTTSLPLRGEEPRRGRVAVEMGMSDDWIVPRQQGLPFRSRPPLQNWLIGLAGMVRGEVDAVAIRAPSILATLLTTLLIYAYTRIWLSRAGATVAGLSYATMGQVLELGGLGETEALFTLLVSGSLLVWHAGFYRRQGWGWVAGYLLVALGTLTKGPQAPVYFVSTVGVYLLVTRRTRRALNLWHVAGIVLLLILWNAWQIPYWHSQGWTGLKTIYGGDVAMRWDDTRWLRMAGHLVAYPLEIVACLLPWSVLLAAYLRRDFRQALLSPTGFAGPARDMVVFLAVALAVTFPTCWIAPGARGRYYMPLYPCFAPLIGLVVECCMQAQFDRRGFRGKAQWQRLTRLLERGVALLMLGGGLVIAAVSFMPQHLSIAQPKWLAVVYAAASTIAQPPWFAVVYMAASIGLAAVVWRQRCPSGSRGGGDQKPGVSDQNLTTDHRPPTPLLRTAWALAIFLGLTYAGVVANTVITVSEESPAVAIARLREKLPPGVRLVSFNCVDHLFAYFWRDPIRQDAWPSNSGDIAPDVVYFCYGNDAPLAGPVDFAFDKLAEISCDRVHSDRPHRVVVVGKIRR